MPSAMIACTGAKEEPFGPGRETEKADNGSGKGKEEEESGDA